MTQGLYYYWCINCNKGTNGSNVCFVSMFQKNIVLLNDFIAWYIKIYNTNDIFMNLEKLYSNIEYIELSAFLKFKIIKFDLKSLLKYFAEGRTQIYLNSTHIHGNCVDISLPFEDFIKFNPFYTPIIKYCSANNIDVYYNSLKIC